MNKKLMYDTTHLCEHKVCPLDMKYINTLTGEVCVSLWECLKVYISDRKHYKIKSWAWVSLKEYNKYHTKEV